MPNNKPKNVKIKTKVTAKIKDNVEILPKIVELDTDAEVEPDEELDPEVVEALKLKQKKPKKPVHTTDYIPELERGEIDIDSNIDDDY